MKQPFQTTGRQRFSSLIFGSLLALYAANSPAVTTNTVTIAITPAAVNSFSPQDTLGAGIDVLFGDPLTSVYSAANISNMLSAGHGTLSYRLNSELGVQDWHWNPTGTWSDPTSGGRGYFTGATNLGSHILHSYVYELPHRGHSSDQQGSDRYSRLTDNSTSTYWKSHPYLSSTYTGEADSLHPQWVIADLGSAKTVNAIRLAWTDPYAVKYQVQYWTGSQAIDTPANGTWQTFNQGTVTNGAGGTVTFQISTTNVTTRFVRVLMTESSGTFDTHGTGDPRNAMGFALAEIYVGTLVSATFTDKLSHSANQNQSPTYVSSTDPWHQASAQTADMEQPGLDFIFTNGLTRNLPTMVPVPMIYSTPQNAAAQIAYLKARNYPISWVELGEEPDGQYMTPEDYGAMYIQWATAIHAVDPTLKLGGPVFAEGAVDVKTWPDSGGETSWLKRFINYLNARGRLNDLAFMSFEHYPAEPCVDPWTALRNEPTVVSNIMATWRGAGLPEGTPILCTEYNFSWDFTASHPALVGALWHADFIGSFLERGGAGAYFYQYESLPLYKAEDCNSWGSFSLFKANASLQATTKLSQFHSSQLINLEWVQPNRQLHYVFPARSDLLDGNGKELVSAYALFRPDGQWSVLLLNKDNAAQRYVRLQFSNTVTQVVTPLTGAADFFKFTSAQYNWVPNGANGAASPNLPPVFSVITNTVSNAVLLESGSLNLIRSAGAVVSSCASNKNVACGSAWSFDAPTFAGSCTNSNVSLLVLSTSTNGGCPQTITRAWQVTDPCGNTNTCTQTVTLLDTVPPVLTCATNKIVAPGAAWSFDAPTALDGCSGSNVLVSVISTVSNGLCPQVVTRTWLATDACGNTNICSQAVTVTDTGRPVNVIKSPTFVNQTVAPIAVTGTADDNIGVDQVLYRFNSGPWTVAYTENGFANWTGYGNLAAGANTFQATTLDGCGNRSDTNSRSYFLIVNSPFRIVTNGSGVISSASGLYGKPVSGAALQIGRIYTVTAKPADGNVFSNWLSVVNGVTNLAGTEAKHQFTMQSNLVLIANFGTNNFLKVAGTYNGLFSDTNSGVAHETAGFFSLKIKSFATKPATFSGRLLLDGETMGFSGKFNVPGAGAPTRLIARKGKSALDLKLNVLFDGSEKVSGTVSNPADGWYSTLTAYRAVFTKTNNPANNYVGLYTLVLPGAANAALLPGGDGYGLVTILTNGIVKLGGGHGDGARLKQVANVSRSGLWPLYAPAYPFKYAYTNGSTERTANSYAGSAWGWVTVASNAPHGLSGTLAWIKKPAPGELLYPGGFTNTITLVASPYTNSALAGKRVIELTSGSDGVIVLSAGNLTAPLVEDVALSTLNKFTANSSQGLKLAVSAKTGKLTGSFRHPDNGDTVTKFYGAILQRSNSGYGWFKGTNQSGAFVVQGN